MMASFEGINSLLIENPFDILRAIVNHITDRQ
jgi:hypothetical protein